MLFSQEFNSSNTDSSLFSREVNSHQKHLNQLSFLCFKWSDFYNTRKVLNLSQCDILCETFQIGLNNCYLKIHSLINYHLLSVLASFQF